MCNKNPKELAENYINNYDLEITTDELFDQFEFILAVYNDFNKYLKETNQLKNFDGKYRN